MSFEQRMNEVREMLRTEDAAPHAGADSPSWDEELFRNGWPNCWGDFNNVMR
jgi:hypothetical protein